MRILHINCSDSGSTGTVIESIATEATYKGYQSFLCAPHQDRVSKNVTVVPVCFKHELGINKRIAAVLGYRYGFAPIATRKILKSIRGINPDLIHLHSANCNMVNLYILFRFIKKNDIPVVVTNHAEFYYTGSCSHSYSCEKWKTGCGNCPNRQFATMSLFRDTSAKAWRKMQLSFAGLHRAVVVSVSPWQYKRALQSPILAGVEQRCIKNGINTRCFQPRMGEVLHNSLPQCNGKHIVLMVTARFDVNDKDEKGGYYFVKLAECMKNAPVHFVVIGSQGGSVESLPDNISTLGAIKSSDELAEWYSEASVVITTSKRETYGMTVAEGLCCGTPVVGFKNGGANSIALQKYSEFIEFGNVDAMKRILLEKWLGFKASHNFEIADNAKCEYATEIMAKSYINLYKEVLR